MTAEAAAAPTARERWAERLDGWVNPIVVKEVRQALRGKHFMIGFWLTLVAATVVGVTVILTAHVESFGNGEGMGQAFFVAIFACLSGAVIGLVPFSAFLAMGAEWEENTYDLLVISNLRPLQIVLGKLLSAAIQTVLYFSAFGPFLVFAFLMQGVDLLAVGVVLLVAFVGSLALSSIALCLSSLTRVRFARVLLLVALGGILVFGFAMSLATAAFTVEDPTQLQSPDFWVGMLGVLGSVAAIGALGLAVACSRLAHDEENRSSPLRAIFVAVFAAALAWLWFFYEVQVDPEIITVGIATLLFVSVAAMLFFVTERETLGRRITNHVPANPLVALLVTPFLPGGGRGMILLLLTGLVGLVAAPVFFALGPPVGGSLSDEGGIALVIAFLYTLVYLGLPSGALSRATSDPRGVVLVRAAIPLLVLVAAFLPTILGFFVGDRDLMALKHPGQPLWLMDRVWNGGVSHEEGTVLDLLVALGIGTLILNLPRMVRGVNEVLAASARRREMLARARSAPQDAAADAVAES